MTLADLTNKQIACLGLGAENYALLEYLASKKIKTAITVFEFKKRSELEKRYPKLKRWPQLNWQTAKPTLKKLENFSVIFRSPGVFVAPERRFKLAKNNIFLTSAMQLFLDLCPTKNIIGVTGTKGKGTTASLIYEIFKKSKKRVWLGGNIGLAPFIFLPEIKKNDWVILELSSFQLQDISAKLAIGVLTNFTPEHLQPADPNNPNYHPTLKDYWQAKFKITNAVVVIANKKLKNKIKAKALFFGVSTLPSRLPGKHNKENIAAAEAVARSVGLSRKVIASAVKNFNGLEHRLQKVTVKNGVTYYNDSFATTPEATLTALAAFKQPLILLAGGADKGSDFKILAKNIAKRVKFLILFKGQGTDRLLKALTKINFQTCLPAGRQKTVIVDGMAKAIKLARKQSKPGDIILLAPGCASFGVFKNYKDRGQQFCFYSQK